MAEESSPHSTDPDRSRKSIVTCDVCEATATIPNDVKVILLSPTHTRAGSSSRSTMKGFQVYKVKDLAQLEEQPPLPTLIPSSSFWSRMRRNFFPMLLSAVLSCCLLLSGSNATPAAGPQLEKRLTYTSVADFSTFEYPIALAGLYANIGPNGAKDGGAASGVVIASPSSCEY